MKESRAEAEARFASLPWPGAKDENFRFTPVSPVDSLPTSTGSAAIPPALEQLDEGEGALLALPSGKLLGEIGSASLEKLSPETALSPLFPDDKFAQLTAARWQNGVRLELPAGMRLTKPWRWSSAALGGEEHYRHSLKLGEGAEAVLLVESWSDFSKRFVGELLELELAKNAKLHWVIVQNYGEGTEAFLRQRIELASGAELTITTVQLGGAKVQVRQQVELGAGAKFELKGALRARGEQHFDFWQELNHRAPRSESKTEFSFVMDGRSRAVFNGLIQIGKDAPQCSASQKAKTLLLGGKATTHLIPKLVIQTDDVKCSHGASVANVNFEQLHYLQSRGIPRVEAERMIVLGFTEPVLERIPTALYHRAGGKREVLQ